MNCGICNQDIKNIKALSIHLRYHHKDISCEDYYKKYINPNYNNICNLEGCNNTCNFISMSEGFCKYCCKDHSRKASSSLIPARMLALYGKAHAMQINKFKEKVISQIAAREEKRKQTCLKRYGHESVLQNNAIKEKMINTHYARYGKFTIASYYDNQENIASSLSKRKVTCIEKYGNAIPQRNESIKEKMRIAAKHNQHQRELTNLERYGYTSSFQNKDVRYKFKSNMINKYGVDHPSKLKEVVDKAANTMLSRYGQSYPIHNRKKLIYDNIQFDSSYEIIFYKYMKFKNKDIKRNTTQYFEYEWNGKIYKTYPDFIIDDKFYEVKGPQFIDKNNDFCNPYDKNTSSKFKAKGECLKRNNVIIIYEDFIKMAKLELNKRI